MNKKNKHAALPQFRRNLKAKAAAGAHATAGRSRVFADKQDKLAKQSADPEIAEGVDEYEAKRAGGALNADRKTIAEIEARSKRQGSMTIKVEIIVDLAKEPTDVADSVRHWLENETKWPDYFISVAVKD